MRLSEWTDYNDVAVVAHNVAYGLTAACLALSSTGPCFCGLEDLCAACARLCEPSFAPDRGTCSGGTAPRWGTFWLSFSVMSS